MKSSFFEEVNDLTLLQLGTNHSFSFRVMNDKLFFLDLGSNKSLFPMNDLNRLDLEWLFAVFRERPDHSVQASHGFGSTESSYFNENVFSINRNLRVVRVDDWRNRQYSILAIEDQGIDRAFTNQMKIFFKFMAFERLHHAQSIYFLILIQRYELKTGRIFSHILKRSLNRIQIMSTY